MNEGTLRVWTMRNFSDYTHHEVATPELAAWMIEDFANADLANPLIHDNAFGLEVWEDGEWTEWYHPGTGEDIGEYSEWMDGEGLLR